MNRKAVVSRQSLVVSEKRNNSFSTNDAERGAALILALGILALITVLAVAFATMMRFEEKAGRNALYLIEARQIASAALQYSIAVLKKDYTDDQTANDFVDSLDEEWMTLFSGSNEDLDHIGAEESRWIYVHANPDGSGAVIGRYAVLIQDEAGKLNLNVAGRGDQNEGWTPRELDLQALPDIASANADNIVDFRELGTPLDEAPGANGTDDNNNATPLGDDGIDNNASGSADEALEGMDDPTEMDPEIPYDDDRPFSSLEGLLKVSQIGGNTIGNLKNYATVWSYDTNQYWSGTSWTRKVNLNHILSTGQIYSLINISPSSELYRLGANMIDYADRDFYPTLTTSNAASPSSSNSFMGLEGLQFNEVKTQATWVARENTEDNPGTTNDVTRSGDWTTFEALGSSSDDSSDENKTGNWNWPWDNGTYDMRIYATTQAASNSIPFAFENQSGNVTANPTTVSNVTVSGGQITLTLTSPQDPTAGEQQTFFDKIEVQAGKFIEIINISQRSITIDAAGTGANVWKIYLGSTPSSPAADGLPATLSGSSLDLDPTGMGTSNITLSGLTSGSPPTYDYLIMADSLYAMDAQSPYGYGDDSGSWSGSGSEPGHLQAIPSLSSSLSTGGTDLALTDGNSYVIAFAATTGTSFSIAGYGSSSSATTSRSRPSSVNQSSSWTDTTPTPGANNSGVSQSNSGQNSYWSIKDRPYATIGELGDVFLGTSNNGTYDVETYGSTYFDKITVSAKRLEAENADSLVWSSSETASDHDGTTRYIASSGSGTSTWNWTFDITDASDITNPFRLRDNQAFDLLVYGQFGVNFQSPSGTNRYVKPNHGVALSSATVSSNNINVPITGTGTPPKLDFIVLTPESYTWGKIDINTASSNVLQALPGIASGLAGNIIDYRDGADNQDGTSDDTPYSQIQEVTAVSGIGEATFKPISNLITVRSDVYRVIIKAERIVDVNSDGVEGDGTDQTVSTINLDVVVDRNPSFRFPSTSHRYRIESQKYQYE